jgi:AraC-like DNA-binding protein
MSSKRIEIEGMYIAHSIEKTPLDREFNMHIHDNFEIFCFISGNADYMVEGKIYSLRPGCIMLMRSAEIHKVLINTNEAYERCVINFYPEILMKAGFPESFFKPFTERNLGERNLYLPSEFSGFQTQAFFEKMIFECDTQNAKRNILSNFASLLVSINIAFDKKGQKSDSRNQKSEADEIIDYINENLFTDISLSSISDTLHISPSQINRIFKKLTGTSVYSYIISKRLIVAQELIAKGENATTASQNCGFHDYSSFYRLYKKHFGTAPTDAKKKIYNVK